MPLYAGIYLAGSASPGAAASTEVFYPKNTLNTSDRANRVKINYSVNNDLCKMKIDRHAYRGYAMGK